MTHTTSNISGQPSSALVLDLSDVPASRSSHALPTADLFH
jgi:hypothetical protein